MILFVMGIMLVVGVVRETGVMSECAAFLDERMSNVWLMGVFTGAVSSVLDNFATAMTMISLREADAAAVLPGMVQDVSPYVQNGLYWKVHSIRVGSRWEHPVFGFHERSCAYADGTPARRLVYEKHWMEVPGRRTDRFSYYDCFIYMIY